MLYRSPNYYFKMNWWAKLVFSLMLILHLSNVHSQETLVGIWQDAPSLGSGWGENYRFFEDGTFVFSHSQMDCQDSVISMGGFYKVRGKKLKLQFIAIEYIEGGTLEPSSGSYGSEFQLVGGTVVSDTFRDKIRFSISKIQQDPEFDHLHFILIGNEKYWKLGWDPNTYE